MKKTTNILYFVMGSLLTVIAAFTIGTLLAADNLQNTGQEPEPPVIVIPSPDPLTAPNTYNQTTSITEADLSGYNIVYLADEAQLSDVLIPEALFGETANIQLVGNMAEVDAINSPVHAVVIHDSAEIDPAWTADILRQQITVVGVDIMLPELAEWLDDECLRAMAANQAAGESTNKHFAYLRTVTAQTEDPAEVPLVIENQLDTNCLTEEMEHPPRQTSGRHGSGGSFTVGNLSGDYELSQFRHALRRHMSQREQAEYNFANRSNPTPLPAGS